MPAVPGGEQPFLEARHVDSAEPCPGRRFRRRAGPERRAARPAGAADPARQARGPAAHHRHAPAPGRPVLPRAHRLPVASSPATPGLPALADGLRVHARLRERGRLGGDPYPPRGDATRAGRQGAEPERGHHRHPEHADDGKGGLAATMPPGRSRAGSATSRSTPPASCWAWWSTRRTSRTRTAPATSCGA